VKRLFGWGAAPILVGLLILVAVVLDVAFGLHPGMRWVALVLVAAAGFLAGLALLVGL